MKALLNSFTQKLISKNWYYSFPLDKEILVSHLNIKKAERILDTGCGDGSFASTLGNKLKAKEVHGIEVDPQYLEPAKKNKVKIQSFDLNKAQLPYKDNYFDLVTSVQVIEHLYFTDTYLEEMMRILKPGGTLAISTTNLAAIHYRLMLLFGVQPICLHPSRHKVWPLKGMNPKWGHKSVFTLNALKQVIEIHGFEVECWYSHTVYFVPRVVSEFLCQLFPNIGTYASLVVKKPKK